MLRRYRYLRLIAFALFLGVAYGPLVSVLAGVFSEPLASVINLFSGRRAELLLRSLAFSLTITVFTTIVGVLAALAILRRLPGIAYKLQWLMLATVAFPPTVAALSWSQFFALLTPLVGMGAIGSWFYASTAQAMALLPFATGVAMAALRTADHNQLDVARVLVSPVRLLFGVAVPLARPSIVSGAALVFLLSLLDYTIPSIFGVNVYSLEIFVTFSATHRVADAFWLSLPMAACALVLVSRLSGLPRRLAQDANRTFPRDGPLPVLLRCLLLLAALLSGAGLLAPLFGFLPAFADPAYLGRTIVASGNETAYTLFTSATAALLSLLLAVGPAIELARGGKRARVIWVVSLLPFLMPPALTGIGLIALWSPVYVIDVYGSQWMTIAAELARFTPVAIVVLSTWLLRTDPNLIDAALVNGSSYRKILFRVLLPLATPGLVAAMGLSFVLSLGEIGANLMVTPAGAATLTMKTYNYLHYGGSQAAAGLCFLLMALAALGAALPALVIYFRRVPRHD